MWFHQDDDTMPVITAREQIAGRHHAAPPVLPKTAVLFFMGGAEEYLQTARGAVALPEALPRFLNRCPVWRIPGSDGICYLDGGRGAPQAADTVEILAALDVKTIVSVGMFGAFSHAVRIGEIVAPSKVFVEEGTSLHYYRHIEHAEPDEKLLETAVQSLKIAAHPIVSTDAVYRQTFLKEQLWRDKGAVGVDMETSAVFSVGRYLGVRVVALMMVSDIHPLRPDEPKWSWHMTKDMRREMFQASVRFAEQLAHEQE